MARVIALEEHIATPEVMAAWGALEGDDRDDMADMTGGDVERRLLTTGDERIADMDASGVDVQVLSLTSPGVQSLDAQLAVRLAMSTNGHIADVVRRRPDRFQGFATLPTPDPAAAASELDRAVGELGLVGAMLHGRTRDRTLDDGAFEPLWARAAALGAPIYVHPQLPQRAVRAALYDGFDGPVDVLFAGPLPGWHYETGVQVVRMILAGVFDRHPDLQLVIGHWGEMMLFYLERIDRMARIAGLELPTITDYFRRNISVTPSGMYSQRYLRWAIEVLGADRIMSSMDYPYVFAPDEQRAFLAASGLSDDDRAKIESGNWERLTAGLG